MAVPTTCEEVIVAKVPAKAPDAKETFAVNKNVKLPELGKNNILVEMEYISVDPYIRGRLPQFLNKVIWSHCEAKVVAVGSEVKHFVKGDHLTGVMPWQTYAVLDAKKFQKLPEKVKKWNSKNNDNNDEKGETVDISSIPKSYFVGQYGMPGMTAYYGLFEKGSLKASDTVLVSGGAGAVGSMVGQIARVVGCKKIIGTAGSQEKLDFMKSIGFTDVINYKEYNDIKSMQNKLKEVLGKDGAIDIYFDNTGGHVTHAQWDLLNQNARVLVCGQISNYNSGDDVPTEPHFLRKLIYKEVDVRGILVFHFKKYDEFYSRVGEWIINKDITVKETVVKGGIDKVPQAFCGLFTGKNIGKMVVDLTK